MGLTSWQGSIVRKQDIYTAKNYLSNDEIDSLNRLVVVFLEAAELRAKDRKDITMDFWRENVDRILAFTEQKLLTHKGSVSNEKMEGLVSQKYDQFDVRRKIYAAQLADVQDIQELKELEEKIRREKK